MITKHEFSRIVELAEPGAGGTPFRVTAEAPERVAVARRLGLLALAELAASGIVESAGGAVRVRGTLHARVTQECVVTLKPVGSRVEVPFERLFVRAGERGGPVVVDPDEPDREPLPSEGLDVGELVVEELSLSLDPYPRAPDADAFLARFGRAGEEAGEERPNPFAVLSGALGRG